MAKTPEEQMANMVENLKKSTGKSLEQWIKLAKDSKRAKHGEIVKFLKTEHGLGHGYANLVAHRFLGSDSVSVAEAGGDLVGAQYAGAKAALRPLYDQLVTMIQRFGKDVEVSPKKTYVSVRRSKQFAILQPSTATRLDVGINLKGVPPAGRLEASGSFNAMVSHRVRVEKAGDIDKELEGRLKKAYDAA